MKLNLNLYWFLKHYQFLLGGIIIVFLIFISLFLYKNFYQTITYTEEISRLRTEVAQEKIDTDLFEKITRVLIQRKKEKPIDWASFKNPFLGY